MQEYQDEDCNKVGIQLNSWEIVSYPAMDRYGGVRKDMDPDALGVNDDLTGEVGAVAFGSNLR